MTQTTTPAEGAAPPELTAQDFATTANVIRAEIGTVSRLSVMKA